MAESVLVLRDISIQHGPVTTLKIPSLTVYGGEVLAIVGPNGAGKSTLLRVMGLLQKPSTGTIVFAGEEVTAANSLAIRRRMGSVFQEPLLLNQTLFYNASLGLKLRGLSRDKIEKQLRPWLERLNIARLVSRQARTLSGGEAQRTSLARSLCLNPELLLLDEPFSALDAPTRESLLLDLQQILRETGISTVIVTHDLHEARMLGQRIGVLSHGRLLQLDLASEVFTRPCNEEVAEIVGVGNRIPARVEALTDGRMVVLFCGCTVPVKGDFKTGERALLCLRAEDIKVSRSHEEGNRSERVNQIKAKAGTISPWMSQYRIAIRAGDHWLTALISKPHFAELRLGEGDEVLVSFDSADLHVIRISNGA
ncbi:MAG: ABC transporter ATP-binding protein [Candidatus Binatia bacterium]